MNGEIKAFAKKVCGYTIGPKNMKITGTYEQSFLHFKEFEILGPEAKQLHLALIEIEDTE